MRLNLGCADIKKEGWTNVDNRPEAEPDLVANALNLPFDMNTIDEIYAGHLVEHLYPEEAERAVKYWYSLLKPGGTLRIVTPDFNYLAKSYLAGAIPIEEMTDLYVFSYVQDSQHRSLWDQTSLLRLLSRNGFKAIAPIDRMKDDRLGYPADWQCGAEGVK